MQIEPILSGNLPPGFDSATCRSVWVSFIFPLFNSYLVSNVNWSFQFNIDIYNYLTRYRYVGNIHPQVTEPLLQEIFSSTGALEGCKLIRKENVWSIHQFSNCFIIYKNSFTWISVIIWVCWLLWSAFCCSCYCDT